jgi:hypothetical protein
MINSFRKICTVLQLTGALTVTTVTTGAAVFTFNTDPFAGSTALTDPGRQIVGAEEAIEFNIATDVFALSKQSFGVSSLNFINDIAANIPAGGVNVVALQNFDVPMAAGIAANLIAGQITESGPGFFIYFNSGLDLPRLVFSTDLSDPTADLKVLFRMTNLSGQGGRDAFPSFSAANFQATPDAGSSLGLLSMAGGALLAARIRTERSRRS